MNDAGRIVVTWHSTYGLDIWEGHDWCETVARVLDFWAPEFIRGDVDGNGEIDLSDVLGLLGYLFTPGSPPPYHPDACDTDDSGKINLADAIHLLMYLFTDKVKALPHPFPYWGFDTTEDKL